MRAILFDLFDTLVDLRWERVPKTEHAGRQLPAALRAMHERIAGRAAAASFEAFLEAMESCRRDFGESHLRGDREVPTPVLMAALLSRLGLEDPALVGELTRLHMGGIRAGVVAVAHHPEVLGRLARRARLGLCSNFTHSETALAVLEETGLRPHLAAEALVISDAAGWRKPSARIFEAAFAGLGARPEEVLHVGDSLRADVAGAAALGARTVWITRCVPDPEAALAEHRGPGPDHVIRDLAELPGLLGSLG